MQASRHQHPNGRRRIPPYNISISGRKEKWFGTGRVMSQIAIVALRALPASWSSEAAPTGSWMAFLTAAKGSGKTGIGGLRNLPVDPLQGHFRCQNGLVPSSPVSQSFTDSLFGVTKNLSIGGAPA